MPGIIEADKTTQITSAILAGIVIAAITFLMINNVLRAVMYGLVFSIVYLAYVYYFSI